MADQQETVILNFEIDQTEAHKALIQTEKNILALKKQQQDLNKEYKAGKISEDQYVKSNIELQKAVKKETDQKKQLNSLLDTESNSRNAVKIRTAQLAKEYDNLNTSTAEGAARQKELAAELSKLSGQISKTSDNAGLFKDQIGNYPKQFGEAAKSINVAGVSVGDFAAKTTSLLNPATAAAGVISLLGSAFLSTRTGAELLESAQFKLQASFQILGRETAKLFETLTSGGPDSGVVGFFKSIIKNNPIVAALAGNVKLLDLVTGGYISKLDAEAASLAAAKDAYDNLLRTQIEESEIISELERKIEVLKTAREEEGVSNEKRLAIDLQVLDLETQRFQIQAAGAIARRDQLEQQAKDLGGVNALQDEQLKLLIDARNEVKNLEAEYALRIRKIKSDVDNLNKSIAEAAGLENADNRAQRRALDTAPDAEAAAKTGEDFLADSQAREFQMHTDFNKLLLEENKKFYAKDLKAKQIAAELKFRVDQAQLQATTSILGAAASLFDQQSSEYKIFATAQALISTYAAATKAYEAAFIPPTIASPALGAAYAAAAIAQGLANVAAINNVQFAEGGYTGPGPKMQPAGTVHAGEVVWSQKDVAMSGGPAAANAMRPTYKGYADGGFVTTANTAATNQSLLLANALKNIPAGVIGVREFNTVARRVEIREQISKR